MKRHDGFRTLAAITAYAAGWIRTSLGDYRLAFWGSGALCVLAALLALQVGAPERRRQDRKPSLVPAGR